MSNATFTIEAPQSLVRIAHHEQVIGAGRYGRTQQR